VAQGIQIRAVHELKDFDECLRLQQLTWGREIAVPTAIFVVGEHTGGLTHAAYDGEKLVGFSMALAGYRDSLRFLHSHMAAVLPEYRDQGIGRALKLAQRADAMTRGINLIEWTFDPLELKNAHFNFNRLGAIARIHIPNCYGITDSPLHGGLPTDRLVAEWWLDSPRVARRMEAKAPGESSPGEIAARIEIPANIGELRESDPERAIGIQSSARDQFQKHFANGLVATSVGKSASGVSYLLEAGTSIAGLTLPPVGH